MLQFYYGTVMWLLNGHLQIMIRGEHIILIEDIAPETMTGVARSVMPLLVFLLAEYDQI